MHNEYMKIIDKTIEDMMMHGTTNGVLNIKYIEALHYMMECKKMLMEMHKSPIGATSSTSSML